MKILGIVAEYNPFHNGHKYHIEKAKEITGADYTVVIMSGNFVQRGEAAILDKWERSRIAVMNGADLVIELPFVFACNKASDFACGAVDILEGIGATHISFGSESGDISKLTELVTKLDESSAEINNARITAMDKGLSYAKGTEMAVRSVLGDEWVSLMLDPNNILAVEYLKRIREKNYNIKPVTVQRYGSGYYGSNDEKGMAGATVIREMVQNGREIRGYVPFDTAEAIKKSGIAIAVQKENTFRLIQADILRNSCENLAEIYCIGEGIENKLKKEISLSTDFDDYVGRVVSRRYTQAAVKRMMTYVLMSMKEEPQRLLYARVLAAGMKGRELVKLLKKQESAAVPVITNINKESDLCQTVWQTMKYDVLASDIYNVISGRNLYEYSDKVIRPYIEV